MLLSMGGRKTNLTSPRTTFRGRETTLGEIEPLLASGLLTLIGPGGIGKTRLATRIGELCLERETYPGGVWFCDLSSERDADAIAALVGRAMSLQLGGGDPVARVADAFAERGRLLLILDNCEQATEAVAACVARIRAASRDTHVLATSRDRLQLVDEQIYEVDALGEDEALALFVERVRLVRPSYALTPESEPRAREVVRRLDAFPLAIELAAARMRLFDERTLLEKLDERFSVLVGGPRDAPLRHRTLHATVEWSWHLLSDEERAVLAQCACFEGGFTVALAEQVVRLPEGGTPVHAILQSLRDKSLLRAYEVARVPGDGRIAMYESVRAFVAKEANDDALSGRHARAILDTALPWARGIDRHGGKQCLARLGAELPNLSAAHAYGVATRSSLALEAMEVLTPYLALRGPTDRFMALLDGALAIELPPSALRARVQVSRAIARWRYGQPELARADLEEALPIARAHADRLNEGRALRLRALLNWQAGLIDEAQSELEGAIEILSALPAAEDPVIAARARGDLARLYDDIGEHAKSKALAEEAIAAFRALGSAHDEGLYRVNLAIVFHREGRLAEAHAHYRQALDTLRAAEAERWVATALENLGLLHQEEGRFDEARACFDEALRGYRSIGDRQCLGTCIGNLAGLAHELGNHDEARRAYDETIDTLRAAGRASRAALLRAARGAVLADLGLIAAAKEDLDAAERDLSERGADLFAGAAALYRGHLDVATGRVDDAAQRFEQAAGLSEQSDEVRLAYRLLRRLVAPRSQPAHVAEDSNAFVIHRRGEHFRAPGGERVDLAHRETLRRMLEAFVARRGSPMTVDDLVAAGWPGERMSKSSGASRVYTALSTLRNLGLRDAIRSVRGRHELIGDVMITDD